MVKNLPAMREDGWGSIPDLGRCPGDGHGNPLQYSGLENPMDRGAWQGTVRGSQRVRHNLVANTHTQGKPCIKLRNSLFFCVERCQPLDAFLPYAPQLSGPHSLSWFCVGRCQPLDAFLPYTPQLSGPHPLSWLCASMTPCSPADVEDGCCAFPLHQLLGSHQGGWRHLLDRRQCGPSGEPSFTFGVADSWNRR